MSERGKRDCELLRVYKNGCVCVCACECVCVCDREGSMSVLIREKDKEGKREIKRDRDLLCSR